MAGEPDDLQVHRESATLRLRVEVKLREAIAAGRFLPGERLVERELCALLGVSRTSVREALRRLEAEGLIASVPHRGPVVASISPEEARQLYAVRAVLEGLAGRDAALHATPEQVAAIRRAVDGVAAAARGGRAALLQAKAAFYGALLDAGGNAVVRQLLRVMHDRVTLLRGTSLEQPGRLARSLAELRAIHRRIAERDADGAAAACAAHVHEAAAAALAALARSEGRAGRRGASHG